MVTQNMRGIKGWIELRRRNFEKFLFLLHRVSGIVVGLYFILHVIETGRIVDGRAAWESLMEALYNPLTHTGLLVVAFFSLFHAFNGLRLLLAEQGVAVGKATRQGYPVIPVSLRSPQRKLGWIMLMLTLFFTIYVFHQLFIVSFPTR